jgi:hypothetical protein
VLLLVQLNQFSSVSKMVLELRHHMHEFSDMFSLSILVHVSYKQINVHANQNHCLKYQIKMTGVSIKLK